VDRSDALKSAENGLAFWLTHPGADFFISKIDDGEVFADLFDVGFIVFVVLLVNFGPGCPP
jgi:hypothetical protein